MDVAKHLSVHVFLMCHNEQTLLPLTVRHYRACFPHCAITIFDNLSTDDSAKLAVARMCTVVPWDSPVPGQLDEPTMTGVKNTRWKPFVQPGTWVIVCDMDEWLVISLEQLLQEDARGTTILSTDGWQMVGESQRADLSDIDPSEVQKGYPAVGYSKHVCFKWDQVDPRWGHGCHESRPVGTVVYSKQRYLMKHMSALGAEFFVERNASRHARNKDNREKYGWCGQYVAEREGALQRHARELAKALQYPETSHK